MDLGPSGDTRQQWPKPEVLDGGRQSRNLRSKTCQRENPTAANFLESVLNEIHIIIIMSVRWHHSTREMVATRYYRTCAKFPEYRSTSAGVGVRLVEFIEFIECDGLDDKSVAAEISFLFVL